MAFVIFGFMACMGIIHNSIKVFYTSCWKNAFYLGVASLSVKHI
jgi:hypothetical protein